MKQVFTKHRKEIEEKEKIILEMKTKWQRTTQGKIDSAENLARVNEGRHLNSQENNENNVEKAKEKEDRR